MEKISVALERTLHDEPQGGGLLGSLLDFGPGQAARPLGRIQYTRTRSVEIAPQVLERHRVTAVTNDPTADAFRLLRAQVLMQMRTNDWQTLAVTSPNKGAGKSTVALNLAIGFAMELDCTALLVNADLRDPDVRNMLGRPQRRAVARNAGIRAAMSQGSPLRKREYALPALRVGPDGNRHIDMRAVATLALPLMLNSTLQAVLNLTDTWFIGRLSTTATAAISAVIWLSLLMMFLIGGVFMGVQALVAQAYGAGRYRRTSQMAWMGLWSSLLMIPAFVLTIVIAPWAFAHFGLQPEVEALALEFWGPRMIGGPLAAALWAIVAYFNGIGHTACRW